MRPGIVVLVLFLASPLAADDLDDLSGRLDAPDWETRDEATRALIARGLEVVPAMEALLDSPSEEVRGRAAWVLDEVIDAAGPEDRAAWIARGAAFDDLSQRWEALRSRLVAVDPARPEVERVRQLRELEEEPAGARRLGHREIVAALATSLGEALERDADRCLEKVLRERPVGPKWLQLLDEAYGAGTLRGQAFEDLVLFLLDPDLAPDETVFGDETGRRTAFALLVALDARRNVGPGPARSWEAVYEAIEARDLFAGLRNRVADWRAGRLVTGKTEARLEIREESLRRIPGEETLAYELAVYPAILDLRRRVRGLAAGPAPRLALAEALGPREAVHGWDQDSWLVLAEYLSGRPSAAGDVERELVRRLEE